MLDTNILVRAAMKRGQLADTLLEKALTPPHTIVLSQLLISEVAKTLRRLRAKSVHNRTDMEIDGYVTRLCSSALVVVLPIPFEPVVPDDPDDDHVIAAAVTASAFIFNVSTASVASLAGVTAFATSSNVSMALSAIFNFVIALSAIFAVVTAKSSISAVEMVSPTIPPRFAINIAIVD